MAENDFKATMAGIAGRHDIPLDFIPRSETYVFAGVPDSKLESIERDISKAMTANRWACQKVTCGDRISVKDMTWMLD